MPTQQETQDQTRARHDRILHELEEHTPEGRGPERRFIRTEMRYIIPIVVLATLGGLFALYRIGGWPAVGIGVVLLAFYYGFGWWAELAAVKSRATEHHQLERIVEAKMHESDGTQGEGARAEGSPAERG